MDCTTCIIATDLFNWIRRAEGPDVFVNDDPFHFDIDNRTRLGSHSLGKNGIRVSCWPLCPSNPIEEICRILPR